MTMDFTALYRVAVLALAATAVSLTITRATIFAAFRAWVVSRSAWLGKLVSCPYCTSHWVAFALVGAYRPVLVPCWLPLDLAVSAFAMVTLSAAFGGTVLLLLPMHGDNVTESAASTSSTGVSGRPVVRRQ
jgi:hypothetical protein